MRIRAERFMVEGFRVFSALRFSVEGYVILSLAVDKYSDVGISEKV